tara:strand:+ start:290 stop:481 length:192 start_codon:yes stop_codon:yes gene_type:complete
MSANLFSLPSGTIEPTESTMAANAEEKLGTAVAPLPYNRSDIATFTVEYALVFYLMGREVLGL